MRTYTAHAFSYAGALMALMLLCAPASTHAAATFVNNASSPFISSIALIANGDVITAQQKTRENVRVVVTVEAVASPVGMDEPLQSDSYTFTENGSFTFSYHDGNGAYGSTTVTIDNIDRTAPEITLAGNPSSSTNQDVTVTATANEGTLKVSSHTFTENGTFDFVATDEAGNVATTTATLSMIDRVAPTVSLRGDAAVQLRAGSAFVDPGADAIDAFDGSVDASVSGSVDSDTAGVYTLVYTATDAAGNTSGEVSRTVEIVRRSGGGGGGGARSSESSSSDSSGRVLGASTYDFSVDLELASTGADVLALQQVLKSEGFFSEEPTGYFGLKTQAAVRAYQASHGIAQTGVVGPKTRAALSGGDTLSTAPVSVEAQIASLMAQLLALKAKLASLTL